jgi:diguanylate cyclase (GGDEF)-like protein
MSKSQDSYSQILPENRDEVEAYCVQTLFARARQGILVAPFATLFIFWIAHPATSLALGIGWVILNSLPDAFNYRHISRLLKHPPERHEIPRLHNQEVIYRVMQGICWGLAAVVFHGEGPDAALIDLQVMVVLVAISCASIVNMSPSFRTQAGFCLSILLVPIGYYLWLGDTLQVQQAVGLCILLAVQLQYGWDAYRQFAGGVHQLVLNRQAREELEKRNAELDELNRKLRVMAIHDQLTGLYNRHFMMDQLERQREQLDRHNTPCSIVLFDIDHFKRINDHYGHPVGDAILVGLSRRVEALLRQGDVLGRHGGEEFVLLLPMCAEPEAREVAERMRQALADAPLVMAPEPITATASFGVAQLRRGETVDAWLSRVDEALYRAKQQGRNRVAG